MSVNFAGPSNDSRGRSGRVPLSVFQPIRNNASQPFYKVMPQNAVPTGVGKPSQQIGYWNEQVRWRMVKGQRKDLPSNWHFYFLGTGPHADLSFRTRTPGVFWVAKDGSQTKPTGLGTRSRNQELMRPVFDFALPQSLEIVDASRPNSRANSRARSQSNSSSNSRPQSQNRGSRNQSATRQPQQQQQQQRRQTQNNTSRNNNQNGGQRSQSRGRSNTRNGNNSGNNQQDLVAAVREALVGLGITSKPQTSGKNTPKRSKSPAQKTVVEQMGKPTWKRTPHSNEDVTKCFGPRDTHQNFGDSQLVRLGVDYPYYPQLAQLVPSQAAMLFGSEITAHEVGEDIQLTYVYKMKVPKKDPSLVRFLPHIGAFADNVEDVTALDPTATPFTPQPQRLRRHVSMETLADTTHDEDEVEIMDDVIIEDETSA
uniref:Nucleoprotein n=1 Tax=Bat Coronavirus TrGZ19 TaxID=3018926 RepID=A0AA49EBM4_9NIDO|nr:nucleocapsid phosphoprotein [Bat Coronavirus TrGZ19]